MAELERHEYDGSEWWEYKRKPVAAANARPFTAVKRDDYEDSLHELASKAVPDRSPER